MRLIFAGTPEFAATALSALLKAGHTVPLVLTQPDRPAGRGMKLAPSPVKEVALAHGLEVYQPASLKDPAAWAPLVAARPEVMVVAAYGLILPQGVLDIPARGCLNIHASLLPRWRGAAPIQRAIQAGDEKTGITIMQMEAGLDTGPMLLKAETPIAPEETARSLHDRLATQGAALIVEALGRLTELVPEPQEESAATYAAKIGKAEARLDWNRPAAALARDVRAFNPFPGANTLCRGEPLKIWQADPCTGLGEPGTVLVAGPEGIVVACGEGALRLREVQPAGGKRLPVGRFLQGHPLVPGERLG